MKLRTTIAAVLAGVAATAVAAPASAACSMKKYPIPVTMEGLRPMVLATVNGEETRLILDSGADFSGISAKFAADHKLRLAQAQPATGSHVAAAAQTPFTGIAGAERFSVIVQADEFRFANTNFGRAMFMTLPLKEGGLLGQNFLRLTDVEYDFKNGFVFMDTVQDCGSANLAYWASGPYGMLPLIANPNHQTVATVVVNGVRMTAIFDTGAPVSFITKRAAARAGVKTTDPGVSESGVTQGVDRVPIKTWTAPFASVKIDSEEILNGSLQIGDSAEKAFDMLIGADFFLAHHVYVANSQGRIYFTHNGGPVFAARTTADAGAAGPPAQSDSRKPD